jgi:FtsH-binding integral membrane protein
MAQRHSTRGRTVHPKFRAVGVPAAVLIAANVVLMYAVAMTPLAALSRLAFSTPIVGLLVFGGALTAGNYLADRGLRDGEMAKAYAGTAILEATYAVLGGGILAVLAAGSRVLALAVTLVVTVAMTVGIAAYVYLRGGDYSHWNRWSLGAFVVGAVLVLVGTFVPIVLVGGFVCIFAGFTLRLGYEIWKVRADYAPERSMVHALGIYVAFTGVFIHVLQIVVRMLGRR